MTETTNAGRSGPLFSVVIPTYGRSTLLLDAVESVLSQSVGDLECIVVDDASPEPVTLPNHPKLRILRRGSNGGPGAARNDGLDASIGRYVTFLDSDDLYSPERLECVVDAVADDVFVLCRMSDTTAPGVAVGRVHEGWMADTILDDHTPHLGQLTAPRALLERFDERFRACEDVEWWLRTASVAPFRSVDVPAYLFRTHDGDRHGNAVPDRLRERQQLLDVHQQWFADHPGAESFQYRRMGLGAVRMGRRAEAIRWMWRSFRAAPSTRSAAGITRALVPFR